MTRIRTRFYDNDRATLSLVPSISSSIETILADDTLPNPLLEKSDLDFYSPSLPPNKRYLMRYNDTYPGNAYVIRALAEPSSLFDSVMPCGMTIHQMYDLMLWCNQRKVAGDTPYVFLDWDRTLSCVEGLYFRSILVDELKIPLRSYVEFIMGGPMRLHIVRLLFLVFRTYGVHYFILTNNGTAKHDPLYFVELIHILDPSFTRPQLIYTGDMPSKAFFFMDDWRIFLPKNFTMQPLSMEELNFLHDEICRLMRAEEEREIIEKERSTVATTVIPIPIVTANANVSLIQPKSRSPSSSRPLRRRRRPIFPPDTTIPTPSSTLHFMGIGDGLSR